MSLNFSKAVWLDDYFKQGDKSKLLVALTLADRANKDGKAWPAIETIAREARTSPRGVQEACRQLESDGKLRIHYGKGEHGQNVYFLLWTPQPLQGATIAGCNEAAEKAAEKAAEFPALNCTQTVRNNNKRSGTVRNHHAAAAAVSASDFMKAWNELPQPFSKIRDMSDDRKRDLTARLRDAFWVEHWREALKLLPSQPFARGEGDKGWILSADFFLKPGSVAKIIEGKYGRNQTSGAARKAAKSLGQYARRDDPDSLVLDPNKNA